MAQVVSVVYKFARWSHKSYDDQPSYISLLISFAHIVSASFVKMAQKIQCHYSADLFVMITAIYFGSSMWFCITPYLYGVSGAILVVMGKRGLALLQQTSRALGKRSDWSPECGHARWGRLVSRSMSSAGDVNDNGRVFGYENGECESPAWMGFVTLWWNGEEIRLILRCRNLTPESGSSLKIGLIVYYVCTKRLPVVSHPGRFTPSFSGRFTPNIFS